MSAEARLEGDVAELLVAATGKSMSTSTPTLEEDGGPHDGHHEHLAHGHVGCSWGGAQGRVGPNEFGSGGWTPYANARRQCTEQMLAEKVEKAYKQASDSLNDNPRNELAQNSVDLLAELRSSWYPLPLPGWYRNEQVGYLSDALEGIRDATEQQPDCTPLREHLKAALVNTAGISKLIDEEISDGAGSIHNQMPNPLGTCIRFLKEMFIKAEGTEQELQKAIAIADRLKS